MLVIFLVSLYSLPDVPNLTLFPPQEQFHDNRELHSCTFVTLFWVSLSKLLDTREHAFVYVSRNTASTAFLLNDTTMVTLPRLLDSFQPYMQCNVM